MNKPLQPRRVASVIDGVATRPFRAMPDVAHETAPAASGPLARVGMDHVEVPLTLGDGMTVPAEADVWVDLADEQAKGIHMSRLYLGLDRGLADGPLTGARLKAMLTGFLADHAGLSNRAGIQLRFDLMRRRAALVSRNAGWRRYPVRIDATWEYGVARIGIGVQVVYSSTCPCSAALARQLIQERFDADFAGAAQVDAAEVRAWLGTEEAICATPHSQRSTADVEVILRAAPEGELPIDALIDRVEDALQTVVQAAVKREDEQAFALLNGRNAMFCEDAARRVQAALDDDATIATWEVTCRHAESLHPHDAVATARSRTRA